MTDEKEATVDEETGDQAAKEMIMFDLLKEMFAFGYSAAEQMEARAAEFAGMRRERMEEFRQDRKDMEAKLRGRFDESTGEFRGRMRTEVENVMREVGVATHSEISELKDMISDLSEQMDKEKGGKSGSSKSKKAAD